MNSIIATHRRAMLAADRADESKRVGDLTRWKQALREALDLESDAAKRSDGRTATEPSRSILFRSAASIALELGDNVEAERLAARGLGGTPPPEIADELRAALDQARSLQHLALRAIDLRPEEVQLSLSGPEVGHGFVRHQELFSRVSAVRLLMFRTSERLTNAPFQERPAGSGSLRDSMETFLSVPRAASMAITLRLGVEKSSDLEGMGLRAKVLTELLDCLDLFTTEPEALASRLPADYRRNFIALVRRLAPDGKRISQVGFTLKREGRERAVALRTPAAEIELPPASGEPVSRVETITGLFRGAEDLTNHRIRLLVDDRPSRWIQVPPGLMDDIVKPLWGERVRASVRRLGRTLMLDQISAVED